MPTTPKERLQQARTPSRPTKPRKRVSVLRIHELLSEVHEPKIKGIANSAIRGVGPFPIP